MADISAVVEEGISDIIDRLARSGVSLNVTDTQIAYMSKGVLALIEVINNASIKKADAAGQIGADSIKTVDDANALLKALADDEAKR